MTSEVVPSEYCVIKKDVGVSIELWALHTSGAYRGTVGPPQGVTYGRKGGGGGWAHKEEDKFQFSKDFLRKGHFKKMAIFSNF